MLRTFLLILFFTLALLGNGPGAHAGCSDDYAQVSDHIQKLMKRYPELAVVLKDPAGFKAEMNQRFLAAKLKDPKHSLSFDFSEVGMPTIEEMRKMLPGKLKELDEMKAKLAKDGARAFWTPPLINRPIPIPFRRSRGLKMAGEIDTSQEYLRAILKELDDISAAGKVNYDQMLELSLYFSRATGYFDRYNLGYRFKFFATSEDKLQGYHDLPIEEEFKLYKNREFFLFQKDSANKSTRVGAHILEESFAKQDELESVLIPTPLSLNLDVFYHLQPHYLYPLGVTDVPVGADGVMRQSGLFYAHDMGHSGIMLSAMKPYFEGIPVAKVPAVKKKMERWYEEYLKALNAVEDKQLRHAIRHLAFNIHHERGYPLAPSTYAIVERPPLTSYVLFYLFDRSEQTPGMGRFSFMKIPKAWKWLNDFWAARKAEEAEFFGGSEEALQEYKGRRARDREEYDKAKK